MFTATLDTNTLWPSLRRDVLLSWAVEGLYRPVWSAHTLVELHYCEERKRVRRGQSPDEALAAADRLVTMMGEAFADAVVPETDTSRLAPFGLPDANDEHVLAGAFAAGAQVIVTDNDEDFPAELLPHGIAVVSPQVFARDTVSVNPARALTALEQMAQRRSETPLALILDQIEARYAMSEACALLRDAL